MKKFLACILALFVSFLFVSNVSAEANDVTVYVFTKENCPYCEKSKEFLKELSEDDEYGKMFKVEEIQVWDANWSEDKKNRQLMDKVAEKFGDDVSGAPYIVVSDVYSVNGFADSIKDELRSAIKKAYESENYVDVVASLKDQTDGEGNDVLSTVIGLGVVVLFVGGLTALVIFSRKEN